MVDQEIMKYYSSYARLVGRRWRRPAARGFRLSTTRLSVRRLRARLWTLLGLLGRCVRNVRLLTRGLVVSSGGSNSLPSTGGGGRRVLGVWGVQDGGGAAGRAASAGRRAQATAPPSSCDGTSNGNKGPPRPPCMRSNSFYQRAVAECLEFIKCSNTGAAAQAGDDRRK